MKFVKIILITVFLIFGCRSTNNVASRSKPDIKWVFVLAGQSNMAGRGSITTQDTLLNKSIFTLNQNMQLELAKEPLHFYEPKLAGVGPGFAFAKELKKHIPKSVEIILVPCAVGGSTIEQWLNDSTHRNVALYSNFKKRVTKAKEYGDVKAILWLQGESNANEKYLPSYKSKLKELISNFRKDVSNPKLPVILGQLGRYATPESKYNNWMKLNAMLDTISTNEEHVFMVSSEGLAPNADKVHYNTEAQHILGKRYAYEYLKSLNY